MCYHSFLNASFFGEWPMNKPIRVRKSCPEHCIIPSRCPNCMTEADEDDNEICDNNEEEYDVHDDDGDCC